MEYWEEPYQREQEKKKSFWRGALTGALAMLLVCVLVAGGVLSAWLLIGRGLPAQAGVSPSSDQKLARIKELIDDHFLYADEVEEGDMKEGLYEGYVASLGDPYSVYYDEENTQDLNESLSGEFYGIGVLMSQDPESLLITAVQVYEGSPAEEAGVQEGDILYKVDGEEVTGKELSLVVQDVRGEEGTQVDLVWLRGEDLQEVAVTATRRKIETVTVATRMLEGQIGYLQITEFDDVTYDQFCKGLEELESQGMQGLVVDLRSNPGGNLSTTCQILDEILPEGLIVSTKDRDGRTSEATSDEEHKFTKPMAVLVDGNSASASEIFAGAIQDYQLGPIVGTTSYGKGIVQNIYDLGDGTSLKLTTSEYFTPKGRSIHGKGIEPDVEVPYEPDENDPEADNQLDAAVSQVEEALKQD